MIDPPRYEYDTLPQRGRYTAIGESKGVFERWRTLPERIRSAPITSALRA
jgi:hypothetical protein